MPSVQQQSGGAGSGGVSVRVDSGTTRGPEPRLNVVAGESVVLTVADAPAQAETVVTVSVPVLIGGYF